MDYMKEIKEYGLPLIKPEYNNDFEVYMTADENDGDYVRETNATNDFNKIKKLIEIINKVFAYDGDYNWEDREKYLTDREINLLYEYVPSSVNDYGVHSIVEATIWYRNKNDGIRYEIFQR